TGRHCDRQCPRSGGRRRPGRCGDRGRRGRAGRGLYARDPRRTARRYGGAARHQPGGTGGLADPVRVPGRRRAPAVRAAADGERGGAAVGPGGPGRPRPGHRPARDRGWRHGDADPGTGDREERRRTAGPGTARPDRPGRRGHRRPRRGRRHHLGRTGTPGPRGPGLERGPGRPGRVRGRGEPRRSAGPAGTGAAQAGDPGAGSDEMSEVVSAFASAEERDAEASVRPRRLAEFVGQHKVREQLDLLLRSALRRGSPPDHILLSGSPGLGKTTLAMIVAAELGAGLRITSGPAIERAGDLAAILTSLGRGDVLFIDEIHRVARPAEELLYSAMEDFRVDVVVGKGPGATAIPLDVEPFTLVGATTRAGLLTGPMRDRFGFVGHLEFYEAEELEQVLHRSARILGVPVTPAGAAEIAGRSR